MNPSTAYVHAMCLNSFARYQKLVQAEAVHARAGFKTISRGVCSDVVEMEANKVIASGMILSSHLGWAANDSPFIVKPTPECA